MFAGIAPRYDLVNSVLSMGIHHSWRRKAVAASGAQPGHHVLDCACGTGDLSFAFAKAVGNTGQVVGTDFCEPMLEIARDKGMARGATTTFQFADAMSLPFSDDDFDIASISFGIRNVDDPGTCLMEMARTVRPGGRVIVLEFGQPTLWGFRWIYRQYSRWLMPVIGGLISGDRDAYTYLPETAAEFPSGNQFLELMDDTRAFSEYRAVPLMFGIAWIYVGVVQ